MEPRLEEVWPHDRKAPVPWRLVGPALVLCVGFASGMPGAQAVTKSTKAKTAATKPAKSTATKSSSAKKAASKASATSGHSKVSVSSRSQKSSRKRRPVSARAQASSLKLKRAFVASEQLRPMAQQLAQMRTPAAYAGVNAYAQSHTGDAASAAYLALGNAYLQDKRYVDAAAALQKAAQEKEPGQEEASLADYADYLGAQANSQAAKYPEALAQLKNFSERYPDSIFRSAVPTLVANIYLQQSDAQSALAVLGTNPPTRADGLLALARAQVMAGQRDPAARTYRRIYVGYPLSNEAQQARQQLTALGADSSLTLVDRKEHADALLNGHRYADAGDEYHSLATDPGADAELKQSSELAAAECDLKTKRLSTIEAQSLPDSNNEAGALRLYLLMELARGRDDGSAQTEIVKQMTTRFPSSRWLEEALFSSGNMYLLRKDYPRAVEYYSELADRFPRSSMAPSAHWRAGWWSFRQRKYSDAAQYFDNQIARYAGGKEIPSALYWRGRLFQDQEHKPELAAAYYHAVIRTYGHYFYAELARQRLAQLGSVQPAAVAGLERIHLSTFPALSDDVPEDDPHVVKAKLLANAGLNDYIAQEIRASAGSEAWGAFAEADIYSSYGEAFRAMRVLKRAIPFYTSAPIDAIPITYWKILFPEAYWNTIKQESAKNQLDPYMVASLIRQESEFNPGAISHANAYGLMQLLPAVGRQMAKQEGSNHFNTADLLEPNTNIRLGTRYLKQMLDKFNDQPEYAFAAYNAGDHRVTDWQSVGNYSGIDEFVESIPFTETRDYVQSIIRNQQIYKSIDEAQAKQTKDTTGQGR